MSGQPGSIGSIVKPNSFEAAIAKQLREHQRQIDELKTARTLAASTLGDSGSLEVDGGEIVVADTSGNPLVRAGTGADNPSLIGLRTLRPSGSLLFGSMGQGIFGLAFTAIYDFNGFAVFSDDPSQGGILRPWMPMGPLVDNATPGTTGGTTTSASYVTIQTGVCVRNHGRVQWDGFISSSSAGTTGNVRLVDASSNVIGSPVAATANTTITATIGPIAWPAATWTYGDMQYLSIQAQRTGGTGTIGVRTTGLHGCGNS